MPSKPETGAPKRYRKRQEEAESVEAIQYAPGLEFPLDFLRDDEEVCRVAGTTSFEIRRDTRAGSQRMAYVVPGNWLIRNPDGSLTTCPGNKLFQATYEPVEDATFVDPVESTDPESESRVEIIERLREIADRRKYSSDAAPLNAAIDLLKGESRTEFRVVGDSPRPFADLKLDEIFHLPAAESWADEYRRQGRFSNVRIQERTVSTTPWVDVEGGKQ